MYDEILNWSDIKVLAGGIHEDAGEHVVIGIIDDYNEMHQIYLTIEQSETLRKLLEIGEDLVKKHANG